jgi:hypothetical protein
MAQEWIMELAAFQHAVQETRQLTLDESPGTVAILGLASATGSVLQAHERFVRCGGDAREDLELRVGDLLWSVATAATAFGLDLDRAAAAVLRRTYDLNPGFSAGSIQDGLPVFDVGYPVGERFPRRMLFAFAEHRRPSGRPVGVPRDGVYDLYWRFAAERHAAFERRVAGLPPPWTTDEIIATYKFCNAYRAADRVSQHLIRDVCYHDEPCTPGDRVFQIVPFRTFSKIDTWRSVRDYLGRYPTLDDLATGSFTAALDHTAATNGGLYTGAFILCATDAYGQKLKHLNHVELFRHLFLRDRAAEQLPDAPSLRAVYELLHGYPLIGDFMAYQLAIDLNYSDLLDFDENEFTQPGPGSLRGIKKCFTDLGGLTPAEVVHWMVDHQDDEFDRLGLAFNGLWGRALHAIDCQNLFCETDKYCRQAVPDLGSARKRIKARFSVTPEPLRLFFPPKWEINDRLPAEDVLGATTPTCHGSQEVHVR